MIHTTRASLRFQILGPVRAWLGDDELDLGAVKQRAVLATLLVNLNRPVPVAQIVDAVWGDRPPENGPNVVQKYVAGLRRTLEPGRSARAPGQLIALTDGGYVLTAPADAVDAEVFERLVRDAEAAHAVGGAAAAGDLLSRALGRWQPPLAGLTGTYFDATRDRLAERRAAALELSADLALDEGRAAAIVGDLTTHVAEYPLRERLRYQLILALYRSGRQPEALAAFRDARQFLIDEFGVEPGAALQELHQRILRGDPDLLPVATAGTWEPPSTVSVAVEPTPEPTAPRVAVAPVAPVAAPPAYPPGFAYPPAPGHLPQPDARSRTMPRLLATVVAVLLSACSGGFVNWVIVGFFGIRRKNYWLIFTAFLYLAAVIGVCLGFGWETGNIESEDTSVVMDITMSLWLASWLIGVAHVAVLAAMDTFWGETVPRSVAASTAAGHVVGSLEWHRHLLRQQARRIVAEQPAVARELRIGRPDLPRHFDDGGLVDINSVSADVLGILPGLTMDKARAIVDDRVARGPFTTPQELVSRRLVARETLRYLEESLVVVER
ncbi:hypothetical protein GCM10009682_29870 [Luedemannella flava]|uniref:OmpR/PhoB-type domain-containing protein n=1 Tax=Luedemannella flava TaxID=349316 RepID=A0ABN2M1V5_9ACTN